jgi:hypothetical protein
MVEGVASARVRVELEGPFVEAVVSVGRWG